MKRAYKGVRDPFMWATRFHWVDYHLAFGGVGRSGRVTRKGGSGGARGDARDSRLPLGMKAEGEESKKPAAFYLSPGEGSIPLDIARLFADWLDASMALLFAAHFRA